jgi:hypothetical protein
MKSEFCSVVSVCLSVPYDSINQQQLTYRPITLYGWLCDVNTVQA